jgi:hypothetical protein
LLFSFFEPDLELLYWVSKQLSLIQELLAVVLMPV